jgi:TetR/AcrR family transcriptional regulator
MANSPGATNSSARVRQRNQTREAVLDAAIDDFSRLGYEGTSLGRISSSCGVKQPLILYHFRNKETLWRAAVDTVWQRMEASLFDFASKQGLAQSLGNDSNTFVGPVAEDELRSLLRGFLHSMAQHPAYLRILLREGSHPGARFDWLEENHTRRNFQLCRELVVVAQTQGLIREGPPEHLVYILAGAMTFIFAVEADVEKQTGRAPEDPEFLDIHVDTLLGFLRPA